MASTICHITIRLGRVPTCPWSVDSADNMNSMNFVGGSVAMSVDNSSVASNESRTVMLDHLGLRDVLTPNYSVCNSVIYPNRAAASVLKEDALAQVLMDPTHPPEILTNYE
ncbi:hypothetical protein ACQ4PT_040266 [Festuca glaucescens]